MFEGYEEWQHQRRDVAAFLAHVLQETGETDVSLYKCTAEGQYCKKDAVLDFWYPCNETVETHAGNTYHKGCYFGRGALQLSWNYNYGLFQQFLLSKGIKVDLINNPNLVMTKMDPPLAMLASLWFYMTPQPPKPSMHSIVIGDWRQSEKNRRAGFSGPIFGPTSLVINNECGGEDPEEPGGPGESRRIKAFKWFCKYFGVPSGSERSLSCKGMIDNFDAVPHMYSWQPDWGNMWRSRACDCEPAAYGGPLPYYDQKIYPSRFSKENERNRLRCVYSIYKNPDIFRLNEENSPCLKHKPRISLTKTGIKK
ncbi:chitinase class I [Necator americanus]|uniref:Chitinase class I n=1 Tax=Necator americanus TaxID=51031 RepID=W2T2R0_NECAM|nr:chitinase class I [Necator americanus]ETN75531.1 chitinase class I [Necator americanus]